MGFFDFLTPEPAFATDPKYRTREAAVQNYVDYIRGMRWPDDFVEVLELEATFAPAEDAEDVYLHMLREGPLVMQDMQYTPDQIRNWSKSQNWLKEAGEASGATTQALEDASTTAIVVDTAVASAEDAAAVGAAAGQVVVEGATAARKVGEAAGRNPWPFLIGIVATGIILRRAKII